MTAFPSQPGSAPQTQAGAFGGRAPILLAFPQRVSQQRLTVLVRILLAIPHLIALWALGIVAEIVAVIGWFGALFTGRLPQFAEDYLSGYLHWHTRVSAYCMLLTEAYPPFMLGDSDYPVRLAVPPRAPLSRLKVFFRIILAIPAAVVTGLLAYGALTIMLFITWLIVLVNGIMPASFQQAYDAVLRYYVRYLGYVILLTDTYPDGLFGDRVAAGSEFTAGTAGAPASFGFPAQTEPGYPAQTEPGSFQVQPGAFPAQPQGSAPGDPAHAGGSAAEPGGYYGTMGAPADTTPFGPTTFGSPWQLVLSQAARRLLGMFLALGVILIVVYIIVLTAVVGKAANSAVTRVNAINDVQASYATLSKTLSTFQAKSVACHGSITCVTGLDRQASTAFDTFGTSIRGTAMPNAATTAAADQLASASLQAGQVLQRLSTAKTAAQYEAIITGSNVQQVLSQVDQDYQNLGTALNTR